MNKQINTAFKNLLKNNGIIFCFLLLTLQSFAQKPTITDVSAVSGNSGSTITISGSGFSNTCKVFLETIALRTTYNALTGNLTVSIPKGVSYDRISVVDPITNLGDESDIFFTLQTPAVCNFNMFSFDTARVFSTKTLTTNIALADLNFDGLEDLLTLNGNGTLTTYNNISTSTAGISFGSIATYTLINGSIPANIITCDLNNDSYTDAVIGYSTGTQISILQGTSSGGFLSTSLTNITVGRAPTLVSAGDLDQDGLPEIIAGNSMDNTISIIKYNKTSRSYTVKQTINSIAAKSIVIGDIDVDRDKDIIIADGTAGYYLSNPNNGFFSGTKTDICKSPTSLVKIGDYNTDKKSDVLFGVLTGVYTSFNDVTAIDNKLLNTSPIAMTSLDIDFDGIPDLATLYVDEKTSTNNIAFYKNDLTNGLISPSVAFMLETGIKGNTNLLSGDLDADGQTDLITYKSNGDIYIYHNSNAPYVTAITGATVCEGVNALVSATSNGTVSWYANDKKTILATGVNSSIAAVSLPAAVNTVYVQSVSGTCSSAFKPATILVNPLPDATANTSSAGPLCSDNTTVVLKAVDSNGQTSQNPTYTFQWVSSKDITSPTLASTNAIIGDPSRVSGTDNGSRPNFIQSLIYTYPLTVTNSVTGCKNSSTVSILVYDDKFSLSSSSEEICSGTQITFTASSFTNNIIVPSLSWSNNLSQRNPGSGVTIHNVTPINNTNSLQSLTYSVTGSSYSGCKYTASKTITVKPASTILPNSLAIGTIGSPYSQVFRLVGETNPSFQIVNFSNSQLPNTFGFSGQTFAGQTSTVGRYTFGIIATSSTGQCDGSATYTLMIEDLVDPNLIVFPVYAHADEAGFFIKPASTQSTGALDYKIKQGFTSTCAALGPKGFVNNFVCADSIPIIVTQTATAKYKGVSIETYIKVSPNPDTKLLLTTTGVILNDGQTQLKYLTNSDAPTSTIQFVQLNNPDVAQIASNGTITPYKQGTITIEVRVPATSQYEAITKTATITVYPAVQKPIVVNDTVVITVNQDTIINILANDHGVTRAIAPAQTDIDMENAGVQNKYYSLSIGNFLIDLNGNLDIKLFSGFIGEGKISYTVTDSAGVKSDAGYVFVKVLPLTVTPGLKANEVMTPNSDGSNDGLVIAYAFLDENNSLTILDEVGNVVYETTNYQNDWRGINMKGKPVEAGIYFYVYEEKQSGRGLKQYIEILK